MYEVDEAPLNSDARLLLAVAERSQSRALSGFGSRIPGSWCGVYTVDEALLASSGCGAYEVDEGPLNGDAQLLRAVAEQGGFRFPVSGVRFPVSG